MKILQADPFRSFKQQEQEISAAVLHVLSSGWYILGKECSSFEKSFSAYSGSKYCLGAANGTDALEIVLRSLGIGYDDSVVTVSNTAVATVAAIGRTGASVLFTDVDADRFTMSPASLEQLLSQKPQIKAVIVVHLFGCPADMDALLAITHKYNIPLIEDCAQAHGAMYHGKMCGTMGIAGCFSFYPTKNLGAFGDGGAIITSNTEMFQNMLKLRQYGWDSNRICNTAGVNSRLDEIQAAILSAKLPLLDKNNQRRIEIAKQYTAGFSSIPQIQCPEISDNCRHVFHQYVIKVKNGIRQDLIDSLKEKGIGTAIHYPCLIHHQPAYQNIPLPVPLTNTESIQDEILSLPMYPELTEDEIQFIIKSIREFFL